MINETATKCTKHFWRAPLLLGLRNMACVESVVNFCAEKTNTAFLMFSIFLLQKFIFPVFSILDYHLKSRSNESFFLGGKQIGLVWYLLTGTLDYLNMLLRRFDVNVNEGRIEKVARAKSCFIVWTTKIRNSFSQIVERLAQHF